MEFGRSFRHMPVNVALVSLAALALATASRADGVRSTPEIPPVATTLTLHASTDPALAAMNPVFVLTPDEAQRKLREGTSLATKSTTAAAYLRRYQSDVKTVDGPADGSGWASLLGVDGNDIVVQAIMQDKNAQATDSVTLPTGIYCPNDVHVTLHLESHYHRGNFSEPGREANAEAANVGHITVTDDKGHTYDAPIITAFANTYHEKIKRVEASEPVPDEQLLTPIRTIQSPPAGPQRVEITPPTGATVSSSVFEKAEEHVYYMREYTYDLPLFNSDGSPRFGRDVRTITVHVVTEAGAMDVKFSLKDLRHR